MAITCPHCKEGLLSLVPANEPYSPEHYQCGKCDSTYPCFGHSAAIPLVLCHQLIDFLEKMAAAELNRHHGATAASCSSYAAKLKSWLPPVN